MNHVDRAAELIRACLVGPLDGPDAYTFDARRIADALEGAGLLVPASSPQLAGATIAVTSPPGGDGRPGSSAAPARGGARPVTPDGGAS